MSARRDRPDDGSAAPGAALPWVPETAEAGPAYHPIRSRVIFAGAATAAGLAFLLVLDLPLDPAFFGLIYGWLACALFFFLLVKPRVGGALDLPLRFGLYSVEILVVSLAARFLGASSWLAILFLLFPVIEWTMLTSGWARLVGLLAALLAGGVLVAGEAVGFVPQASIFPSVDSAYGDPAHALGAFLIAALLITGLAGVVGNYADAGRRKSLQLQRLNAQLRAVMDDLRESHQEYEAAYAELRRTQAELVNSAKMATLGMLVAGVAHEINTPLGALTSNHDVIRRALDRLQTILEDEVVDEHELADVRRIVKAIDGVETTNDMAVKRMTDLVGNLRSFGRPDRSEIDLVDVHEGLESTLKLVAHEVPAQVTIDRDYGELPKVQCYPNQLNQVFMNLVLNACQAIRGPGTVTIRTRAGDDHVHVQVEDTGVGIPEEDRERIFEPGFTTKGSRMGMGLGLLISTQVVEQHGGRLTVESQVGKGSTFTMTVPVRLPVSSPDAAPT